MKDPNKPTQNRHQILVATDPDPYLALREDQFVPYFQPLVNLRTGKLNGFEVLARWQHPTIGLIPPSSFISIAERDGWIDELTRQVLEKALIAASDIPAPITLSFNVSPVQLRDRSLVERIRSMATSAGFPLSRLVIEITESALIDDMQSAIAIVAEIKAMGCRLALDDFGTGYSSLNHLRSLPFDKLKVDRSFVSSMIEQEDSRKIVAAVIGLGQSLGLMTVGEGIETREQAEMMLWLGCDLGQGYFYGRPMPAQDLPASISSQLPEIGARSSIPENESLADTASDPGDLNPQVFWIMDPQGGNLEVGPRWDRATGSMKLQSTDREWLELVDREAMHNAVFTAADSPRTDFRIDIEYRVGNGEVGWEWKRSIGLPRFDAYGNIVCWYGSVQDIEAPAESREMVSTRAGNVEGRDTPGQTANLSVKSWNEVRRSRALLDLEILDTPFESAFDDLVALAAEICATPISLVSLLDLKRQWFKASVGLAERETPISHSLCAYAIQQRGPFIVEDTMQDERFRENPLVVGDPHIRFYAGVPVYMEDGVAIGTLCVIDTVPRSLTLKQIKALTILGQQVQVHLKLRSEHQKLLKSERRYRELMDGLAAVTPAATDSARDAAA